MSEISPSVQLIYKGQVIAEMRTLGNIDILTAGKYCDDNIRLNYVNHCPRENPVASFQMADLFANFQPTASAEYEPTQGMVPGTYTDSDGTIVVKDYHTFVITAKSSSTGNAPLIPLITPITPVGTSYSQISNAETGTVGQYSRIKTFDDVGSMIMSSGANPATWSGRTVYYVSFPTYYYPTDTEYNLTVINNGQVVF